MSVNNIHIHKTEGARGDNPAYILGKNSYLKKPIFWEYPMENPMGVSERGSLGVGEGRTAAGGACMAVGGGAGGGVTL